MRRYYRNPERGGIVAHCIERPAARRARLIMAMRAACKRAAAPGARGYEMPLKRHFRDSSNFWPTAGSASTTSGRKRPSPYLSRFCPKGETPKCTCLFSCTRSGGVPRKRPLGRLASALRRGGSLVGLLMRALPKGRDARQGVRSVTPSPSPS